jgi:hypothetical protein
MPFRLKNAPINRSLQFADKFPDEIKGKNQLQRFLGSLNYISDYYENLRIICKPLYQRLQKDPPPWSTQHTKIVKQVKKTCQSPSVFRSSFSQYFQNC